MRVPKGGRLDFHTGMGPKSPERSDGVWFSVNAIVLRGTTWPKRFVKLGEIDSNAHRWIARKISLAPFGGKTIRLKFIADCGPRNNTTTGHAYWSDVFILPKGSGLAHRTRPERFMTWLGREHFASTFYYRRIHSPRVDLTFHVEGTEPVTIQSMRVHAAPERTSAMDEKGRARLFHRLAEAAAEADFAVIDADVVAAVRIGAHPRLELNRRPVPTVIGER